MVTINHQAYTILSLICISGEMDADTIYNINISSKKYIGRIITQLRDAGFIKLHTGNGLRGYRVTIKGKKQLLSNNHERFSYALEENAETNRVKSELRRRIRLQRIAEIIVLMNNVHVKTFRDEKAKLFYPGDKEQILDLYPYTAFYTSREYKDIGGEIAKMRNARAAGLFITKTDAYMIYNTGDSRMKWNTSSELRAKSILRHYLAYDMQVKSFKGREIGAVLFGKNMSLATELMDNTNKNYFMIDGTFENFFYFTLDKNGEILTRILSNEKMRKSLNASLLHNLGPSDKNRLFEHDAFLEGKPVLLNYFCDLPKLARFNSALSLQEIQGIIICFDFQEEFMSGYCSSNISFQTIKMNKFKGSDLYKY